MKINGVDTTSISKLNGTSLSLISKFGGVSLPAGASYIVATGGTLTQVGNYKIRTFTSTDNFVVTQLASSAPNNIIKILVVAGGGAGGGQYVGGGGGAGGLIENTSYSLSSGATTYDVVVGS